MKKINRILASLLAIALVVLLPGLGTAKVKAATSNTFTVKWIPAMNEWRVQMLSSWDENRENGDLNFLWGYLKEGDSLVVVGGEGSPKFDDLHIDRKLANLTLYQMTGSIIVYADQNIKDIYVLKGSVASIHGSYDNVYVYDNSACNVNNDVAYLYIGCETKMEMNVNALGTVGHCKIENRGNLVKEMYNVKANTLRVVNGEDKTDAANYSTTANATPATQTTTPAATTTTPAATTTTGGAVSPKTGESNVMLLLFLGAAVCFAGSAYARKKMA